MILSAWAVVPLVLSGLCVEGFSEAQTPQPGQGRVGLVLGMRGEAAADSRAKQMETSPLTETLMAHRWWWVPQDVAS